MAAIKECEDYFLTMVFKNPVAGAGGSGIKFQDGMIVTLRSVPGTVYILGQ